MRILALSPCEAYPPHGGGTIVVYNDLVHLAARGHEIHLLAIPTSRHPDPEAIKHICVAEYFYKYKAPRWRRVLANVGSPLPFTVQHFVDSRMMDAARRILRKRRIDVILLEVITTGPYGPPLRDEFGVPFFIRGTNVDTQVLERFVAGQRNPVTRMLGRWQMRKYAAYEGSTLARADGCSMITEVDAAEARRRFPGLKPAVVEAGTDLEYFHLSDQPREPHLIVHVGGLAEFTKLEAMTWFCREVFPLVRQRQPKATLELVGPAPRDSFSSFEGVCFVGRVEDVRPYLWRSRVFIAPQFVGSGVRLKILNAMATGSAIVCTPVACEGIPLADGEDALIRRTPQEFADGVLALMANEELAKRLGRNGRRLAEERYSWDVIGAELERQLELAIARRRAVQASSA